MTVKMENLQIKNKDPFVDILEERRLTSDIAWASRDWRATVPNMLYKKYGPENIKLIALKGHRLRTILQKLMKEKEIPISELLEDVRSILDEIGYNRVVPVLRWLGFFVAKILKKLIIGVHVNEAKFLQIKSQMGNNPLIFLPSHKSYCDFILMSYICFHYEVDIPRIAAGMDFQSMALMGNILRDACAFFMRRSFADDELYSAVFSQYVHTLVTYGEAAIEFFIEGTRSRTQKSLMPKYGLLSMTIKPFLTGLVPDITIVPVNLSYDRILEEILFAYELLGVPKPKETTRGFIKALGILNENYGNVYVQFGDPISSRQYFSDKIDRSVHGFGSVELQDISAEESKCIISLAHSIVRRQRELTILTCFNLVAAVLNDYLLRESEPIYLDRLIVDVQWLLSVFQILAPKSVLTLKSINQDAILHHLSLHKSLIHLSTSKKVQLSRIHSGQVITDLTKLKGHKLSNSSMDVAIPVIMLQNYVNPCASFLIGVCFIALIIESLPQKKLISIVDLLKEFEFLCSVFSFEFVFHSNFIQEDFNKALNQSNYFEIIHKNDENLIEKGSNNRLHSFCVNFLNSFIPGYIAMSEVALECAEAMFSEKEILKTCQQRLESKLISGFTLHPANLSLDLLSNALQSFVIMKAVSKEKRQNGFGYRAHQEKLDKIHSKLTTFNFSDQLKANLSQSLSVFIRAGFSSVKFTEKIPDCSEQYSTHNLGFFRKYLRNYELMHTECAEVRSNPRKYYRFYIGQGIPDPWMTFPCMYNSKVFSPNDLKETKKHRKPSDRGRGLCTCCQKEYLFECPDKCTSKYYSNTYENSKNTIPHSDDKCKCNEIFQSRMLASSLNDSNSETENEVENLNADFKNPPLCECFISRKTYSSCSEKSGSTNQEYCEKPLKPNKNSAPIKGDRKICFCPFIRQLCVRKPPENEGEKISSPEHKTVVSKEIQTDLQLTKNSKTVQTEKPVMKTQAKCSCASKYLTCNFNFHKQWSKKGCQAIYSVPNVCCAPSFMHNPALACPYSFLNHFTIHKCDKHENGELRKCRTKKKHSKERENGEDSNAEPDTHQPLPNDSENNYMTKGRTKYVPVERKCNETAKESANNIKHFYYSNNQPKSFDQFKYLTDDIFKNYVQRNSPILNNYSQPAYSGSKFFSFPDADALFQSPGFEKFKAFSHNRLKPFEPTFLESNIKPRGNNVQSSNISQPYYADKFSRGLKEMKNQRNDPFMPAVDMSDNDETRSPGLIKSQKKLTKVLKKRRKFLASERRRKLANSKKASFSEYEAAPKNVAHSVAEKEIQVQGIPPDYVNLEKIFHAENFNSTSGFFNFDSNSQSRVQHCNSYATAVSSKLTQEEFT